jgi:hypothetical protein
LLSGVLSFDVSMVCAALLSDASMVSVASRGWCSFRHRAPLLPSLSLGPLVSSLGALLRKGLSFSKLPEEAPTPQVAAETSHAHCA